MIEEVIDVKATMKDVAALAGVGVGTVSRVINGVKVKDSTKEKVVAAIEELNYEPDEYARGLKMNRSQSIALILPTIWHPFFSEFAYYVEEQLSKENYKLLLCNSDGNADKEKEYIQMVKQSKVDGIIGITYSDIDKYISSNLPFVSIDRHFSEQVAYVTADNYRGGQLAAEKLIDKGASKLAYIGGMSPYPNETTKRRKGFEAVCQKNNRDCFILSMAEPINDLQEQLDGFFRDHPEIDGIFTINDFMAFSVIESMERLGKQAPADYQLIGFDGIRMSAEQKYIVSTIAQPVPQMAKESVSLLLKMILEKAPAERIVLPVSFQTGLTTKKDEN